MPNPTVSFIIPQHLKIQHIDDAKVLEGVTEDTTLQEFVEQSSRIQLEILKESSFVHFISYFLTNLNNSNQKALCEKAMTLVRTGLETNFYFDSFNQIVTSQKNNLEELLSRVVDYNDSISIEWKQPSFIQFYRANSLQIKDNVHFFVPIMVGKFKTEPELTEGSSFSFSQFDFEYPPLSAKLKEIYARNVAMTLNTMVEENDSCKGGVCVLRGRVPASFLSWMRGGSPLNPSPIPNVEIIYAIQEESLKKEYWFSLKAGANTRIKKNNALIIGREHEIYKAWDNLRPYVVVDELIIEANSTTTNYYIFVEKFWELFFNTVAPKRDQWLLAISDDNFAGKLVKSHIHDFKNELKKESESTNPSRKNKAAKLLKKLEEKEEEKIEADLLKKLTTISNETDKGIFNLDCLHIIHDLIKEKKYDKKDWQLLENISPEVLDENNNSSIFERCSSFIMISKVKDNSITLSVSRMKSETDPQEKNIDYSFEYAFINILEIISQSELDGDQIQRFWGKLLKKIKPNNFSLFYNIYSLFEGISAGKNKPFGKKNGPYVESLHGLFTGEIQEIFNLDKIKTTMESLKSVLDNINIKSDEAIISFDGSNEELNFDLFTEFGENVPAVNSGSPIDSDNSQTKDEVIALLESAPITDSLSFLKIKEFLSFAGAAYHDLPSNDPNLVALASAISLIDKRCIYFFDTSFKKYNIVKFIYVILAGGEIRVAPEKIENQDSNRPTHSELANGLGVQAAGELIFQKSSVGWELKLINNGSGHYRPPADKTLPLAKQMILRKLNPKILNNDVKCLNSLKSGMGLASGWDINNSQDDNENSSRAAFIPSQSKTGAKQDFFSQTSLPNRDNDHQSNIVTKGL